MGIRYTFCTADLGAGTAWLRAGMIASYMNVEGKRECRWISYDQVSESLETAGKDDCYIFLKPGSIKEEVLKAKQIVRNIILDPSDYESGVNDNPFWKDAADLVLYDTDHQRSFFEGAGIKSLAKIRHLHSNFDLKNNNGLSQIKKKIDSIQTVGYMGLASQIDENSKIVDLITRSGLGWYQASPNPLNNIYHTQLIDCQIVHVNKESRRNTLVMKPHNKMMNCFSFGIPCVFSPYDSYMETVRGIESLEWLAADTVDKKISKIINLAQDRQLLAAVTNQSFELSLNYHVSKYETCYSKLFEFVEG
jgi:hypothetical protein